MQSSGFPARAAGRQQVLLNHLRPVRPAAQPFCLTVVFCNVKDDAKLTTCILYLQTEGGMEPAMGGGQFQVWLPWQQHLFPCVLRPSC